MTEKIELLEKNKEINVDNNDKIVDYCVINKDSIWVLSM